MSRRCLRTALLSGLCAALLLSAPAFAAPTATDDNGDHAIKAAPTGVQDVLANDSGGDIRVIDNDKPAHGTASCTALGSCFYEADAGYTGSDSFIYRIRDEAGDEATATVTVNVSASRAGTALAARDDDTATKSGTPVTVDVLDNDTGGDGLTVVSSAPSASHGTVTCSEDDCVYTPAADYTGSDGFHYSISEGGEQTAEADVHILVVPANAGYNLGVTGNPASVPAGGKANWGLQISETPGGLALEELAALPLPQTTASLTGPHAIDGAIHTAKGWTGSGSGTSANAAANNKALLGSAISETFPEPLPPISQGTGGDGHVPILVGSKVFAFYHHSSPTSVTCVDRRTGVACPGYPIQLTFRTSNINGPGVVVGSKIYTHIWPFGTYFGSPGYTQTAPVGLFCWDADTNSTCGYFIFERQETTVNPGASHPYELDGLIYVAGDGGKLWCFDPSTDELCSTPTIPTGMPADHTGEYDLVGHGTRLFITRRSSPKVACVDVVAKAPCTGWETPKDFPTNSYNVINSHDTTGAVNGMCLVGFSAADCVTDADPATITHIAGFVPSLDGYYDVTVEAETGVRTFFGSLTRGGLGCWDWSTGALCAGAHFSPDGWVGQEQSGASLPSAYGTVFDGSCMVAVGDPGRIFTVDPSGASPCTSLSTGTDKRTVDLRDQRCDGTVGAARWVSVSVGDVNEGELQSVIVTVRDAATNQVLATGNLLEDSSAPEALARRALIKDGKLDLSGIDPVAHPAITLDANATGPTGNPAWEDAIPPRLRLSWTSDPQQVCFTSKANNTCASPANQSLTVTGTLTGAADKSATLGLQNATGCTPPEVVAQSRPPLVCGGNRLFDIHIRYSGKRVKKLSVTINGKAQKIKRIKPRPVAQVDLRKFSGGTVTVRIAIRTKSGKLLKGIRVYHPCVQQKLPDRGFKY